MKWRRPRPSLLLLPALFCACQGGEAVAPCRDEPCPAVSCARELWLGGLPGAATGEGPVAFAADDFDGDGKPDLATANARARSISVLLGRGNGAFRPKTDYPIGTIPMAMVAGDWNRDRKPDIATASADSRTLTVFLNQGKGTFVRKAEYQLAASPIAMVAADLDNNGSPDLVVASNDEAVVSVLFGHGDGTFFPGIDYPTATPNRAMVAADFNRDGRVDLVTGSNNSTTLTIMLGKAGRTFATTRKVVDEYGGAVASLAAGDFSGDGKLDLALVHYDGGRGYDGSSRVLVGDGRGAFPSSVEHKDFMNSTLGTADLDGDGRADLASWTDQDLTVLFGGTAGISASQVQYDSVKWGQSMLFGDFNHDGKQDIAMMDFDTSSVIVMPGNGKRTFPAPVTHASYSTAYLFVRDVNHDGRLDAITVSYEGTVTVLMGEGDGTFADTGSESYGAGWEVQAAAMGDLDGDGNLDLVAASGTSVSSTTPETVQRVAVLLGEPGGQFQPSQDLAFGQLAYGFALGDVNGDGKLDMAVRHRDEGSVAIWLGGGDGTFVRKAEVVAEHSQSSSCWTRCLSLVDLNGDAILDLVVQDTVVTVALGTGDGTFTPAATYSVGNGADFMLVADVNGDQVVDIVSHHSGGLSVLLGRADGAFAPALEQDGVGQSDWSETDAALADLDGDGRLDLVLAVFPNKIYVRLGSGDGTFACPKFYANGGLDLVIGDMNGDGRPDLVVDDANANTLSVLMNRSL